MIDLLTVHYTSVKALTDFPESLGAAAYMDTYLDWSGTRDEEGDGDESDVFNIASNKYVWDEFTLEVPIGITV